MKTLLGIVLFFVILALIIGVLYLIGRIILWSIYKITDEDAFCVFTVGDGAPTFILAGLIVVIGSTFLIVVGQTVAQMIFN